ncbi:hypothetical protein GCM10011344_25620 [Dokdonia pacifica]|uniref:Uncharacterized protein n=1 Tax=Dokdonia pacifica TaxID=1627892 RepID=A0A238WS08_9FLAO|nr:hypothetical protein [Dokdonia pacifica]GGG23720.1 hypothetical protein GCM10011344_25620 [Dokdonia pacifica]SNR49325.1 hypothetical protein SAMN06265376_1011419 [Dokdonia pacifica]
MFLRSSLFIVILIFQLHTNAQEQVSLEDFGVSFTLPAGWTGDFQGDYVVLGHTTIPGMMILSDNPTRTIETVVSTAQQGIQEDGFNLTADGTFKKVNAKRAEGYYKGTYDYSTKVKAYAIGLIDGQGKGMSILILTETNVFSQDHVSAANQLATSVNFFKPKASKITKEWEQRLVGQKLTYRNTGDGPDGGSVTRIINLCTNGTFTFYFNAHASFDVAEGFGYANSNEDSRGRYTIYSLHNDSYLTLNFDNGKEIEYKLTLDPKEYPVLNNTKFIPLDAEGCE